MKKKKSFILLLTFFAAFTGSFLAQENKDNNELYVEPYERAYSPGNMYFNAGVNLFYGSYNQSLSWSNYNYSSSIPVVASLEYGFTDLLSFGGYMGFRSYGWSYTIYSNKYDYSNRLFNIGVRGSFHYLPLLNEHLDLGFDERHFDFYATLMLGARILTESVTEPNLRTTDTSSRGFFGGALGFRYMFNNTFGAYVEGGRSSLGRLNIGLTIKI